MSLSVAVIEASESGDHSYAAHDGEIAVVVDPQRDLDRAEQVQRLALPVSCPLPVEKEVHVPDPDHRDIQPR